ncbi:MAG: M56 family metallopeptidase [Bacteroidota bacterium]
MTGQANFLQSLGWAVLNSLWQLALLWVIYQIISGIFRTAKPSSKSLLASALLISGSGWFIYTFFTAYLNLANKTVIPFGLINEGADEQINNWLQQTLPFASALYLILLVLPLLQFVRNYRYVQVIRKYGLTKMNVEWRMFVSKIAVHLTIKKKVQIWISEFVSSPVTIGFLKPVILVPLAAINHLTTQQLEAVLLHELSHIKRHDYLINLCINIIHTLLYFNPFVKAFVKIVEREREKSCDEMVLQFQYASYDYASALLSLEKANHSQQHFAIAAADKKNDLLQRVQLIMGVNKKPVFSFNKTAGIFIGIFCIISLNVLLIKKERVSVNKSSSLADISSPFTLVTGTEKEGSEIPANLVAKYELPFSIKKSAVHFKQKTVQRAVNPANYITAAITSPEMMKVNFEPVVEIPELKRYQENQVKEALQASKKVLESAQWKAVEKSIADVFTQKEKDEIRSDYQMELNNFDWKKWENKLRIAYNKVDWEKVNSQLNNAINQVRLDSLQQVYNNTVVMLSDVEKELTLQKLNGIPDSDITMKAIEDKKRQAQKALNNVRAIRTKKIVHL